MFSGQIINKRVIVLSYLGLLEGKHSKPGIDADCFVQNGFPILSQCKLAILGLYAFLDNLKPYRMIINQQIKQTHTYTYSTLQYIVGCKFHHIIPIISTDFGATNILSQWHKLDYQYAEERRRVLVPYSTGSSFRRCLAVHFWSSGK